MYKKGQITLFIIIGIIILITISLALIFNLISLDNNVPKINNIFSSKENTENQIKDCVKDSLKQTLKINSPQGGYYLSNLDSVFYTLEELEIYSNSPYYLINKEEKIISKSKLSEEISLGVLSEIEGCLESIEDLEYDSSNIDAETKFIGNKIIVNAKIPSQIKKENSIINLEKDYTLDLTTDYLKFYNLAIEITQLKEEDLCLSCIHDIAEKYNLKISMVDFTEENTYNVIYYIFGEDELIPVYSFAHQRGIE